MKFNEIPAIKFLNSKDPALVEKFLENFHNFDRVGSDRFLVFEITDYYDFQSFCADLERNDYHSTGEKYTTADQLNMCFDWSVSPEGPFLWSGLQSEFYEWLKEHQE